MSTTPGGGPVRGPTSHPGRAGVPRRTRGRSRRNGTRGIGPGRTLICALDGGPIGRVREDDLIEIVIDRNTLTGSVNLVGAEGVPLDPDACQALLLGRPPHPGLAPHERLPDDSRLWAALQRASGGTWGGCVYDVDRIVAALDRAAADVPRPLNGG